jgi:hypothetical protein
MIPADTYTISVIVLLSVLGVLGLLHPRWFILVSRFPYMKRNYPPITDTQQRIARRWGVMSLVGAVILVVMAF